MNLMQEFEKKHSKKSIPNIKPGDVVRVHEKIKDGKKERIQIFEGIVLKMQNGKGLNATFTVRKISFGIGVEKTFPFHLPSIVKIETIKKIKNRKSKLYYLRNLTDRQIKKRNELKEYAVWNDEASLAETQEIKKRKEEEAKQKTLAKQKEQEELNKKFAQAKDQEQEPTGKEESDKKENDKQKDSGK